MKHFSELIYDIMSNLEREVIAKKQRRDTHIEGVTIAAIERAAEIEQIEAGRISALEKLKSDGWLSTPGITNAWENLSESDMRAWL